MTPSSICKFTVNLEQSGTRNLDTWPIILTTSLIAIFYLTKSENKTKKYPTQLLYYCFENPDFLQKNADISKIKEFLVLKGIFSEETYICFLTYQISSF